MNTQALMIPGPAQIVLTMALELPVDCSVGEMVDEIHRLKLAAAEGPNFADDIAVETSETSETSEGSKPKAKNRTRKKETA